MFLFSGIHGVIKRDAHQQFGRLPYLTSKGETYYLDLLVWRANRRLEKMPFFYSFSKDLWNWTHHGLEDWAHIIPPFEEDVLDDEEHDDKDDGEDEDVNDDAWFIPADKVLDEDDDEDFVLL